MENTMARISSQVGTEIWAVASELAERRKKHLREMIHTASNNGNADRMEVMMNLPEFVACMREDMDFAERAIRGARDTAAERKQAGSQNANRYARIVELMESVTKPPDSRRGSSSEERARLG